MDCKNIRIILERYWNCESSLEDESQLREFFLSEEVPADLLPYKGLFAYQQEQQEIRLGADFDAKMMRMIEEPVVKAKKLTFIARFKPLMKAAAMVAVIFSLGTVLIHPVSTQEAVQGNSVTGTTAGQPEAAVTQDGSTIQLVDSAFLQKKEAKD